jgi:hypothetical protein
MQSRQHLAALGAGATCAPSSQRENLPINQEAVSTGDEFHSIVVWTNGALVFDIVEIEDGKPLKSTEIWSLIDGGRSLQRVRRSEKAGEQTLIYSLQNRVFISPP